MLVERGSGSSLSSRASFATGLFKTVVWVLMVMVRRRPSWPE